MKLRGLADNMTIQIDEKLNPAIGNQNWTQRRARIANRIREDGLRLEKVQYALYAIADLCEHHTLNSLFPIADEKSITKQLVECLVTYSQYPRWDDKQVTQLSKVGITVNNYIKVREQLLTMIEIPDRSEMLAQKERYNKTREMVGQVDGYYPTPPEVVDLVLDEAGIEVGITILEPSCGTGAFIARLLEMGIMKQDITAVEWDYTLASYTEHEYGIKVLMKDFMAWQPQQVFDRIVMNPPFEKQQDIDHVTKAFSHLAVNGRLVSVMSLSWQFRDNVKSQQFRELMNQYGYHLELPKDAFKSSGTGVASMIVILNKNQKLIDAF